VGGGGARAETHRAWEASSCEVSSSLWIFLMSPMAAAVFSMAAWRSILRASPVMNDFHLINIFITHNSTNHK